MDVGIALSVVPIIVGLLVLGIRLGLPQLYEVPLAIVLGVGISVGYIVAGAIPGGDAFADALFRGVAVGLSSAGLIGTVRRLVQDFTCEKGKVRRSRGR